MSHLDQLLDRREFAETADAILYARPRFTTIFFPLFALAFFAGMGWLAFVPFEETVHARGDLRVAGEAMTLQAPEEGRLLSVHAREGERVEKGAVLFRLDEAPARMELDRVAAEIGRVRETVALLDAQRQRVRGRGAVELGRLARDIERNQEMHERGIIPKQIVENLESERRALTESTRQEQLAIEAEVVAARQALDRLESERARRTRGLAEHIVRAAESGVITRMPVRTPGELIPRGTELAKITPRHRALEFEAIVPPHEIARVRTGLRTRIELDAYPQRQYGAIGGRVVFVAPDREEKGYRIRVAAEPSPLALRPGMTGKATIIRDRRPLYRVVGERLGFLS